MNGGAYHAGARFDTTKARKVCPRHQKAAPSNDGLEVKDQGMTLLAIVKTHKKKPLNFISFVLTQASRSRSGSQYRDAFATKVNEVSGKDRSGSGRGIELDAVDRPGDSAPFCSQRQFFPHVLSNRSTTQPFPS